VVFLDVQMPEVSGFDVLRALPADKWPAVIFVTAHDQHAVEAFEVHALDYLLKPFTQARLQQAVRHARRHLELGDLGAVRRQMMEWLKSPEPGPHVSRLAVKAGSQTLFVKVEDVAYIESAANYAVVHTRAENHVLRETLISLENRLPPRNFVRISRSIIVNLEHIKSLQSSSHGEYLAVLQDGRQLALTRSLHEVQERLQYPGARA
jgi:two-component system LytT family response regulator